MEHSFTAAEKKAWLLKKYLKEHAFETLLDIILTIGFVFLLLKICKAEDILVGVLLAILWSLGRAVRQFHSYKKNIESQFEANER